MNSEGIGPTVTGMAHALAGSRQNTAAIRFRLIVVGQLISTVIEFGALCDQFTLMIVPDDGLPLILELTVKKFSRQIWRQLGT